MKLGELQLEPMDEVEDTDDDEPNLGDESKEVELVLKYSFKINQVVGTVDIGFSVVFIDAASGDRMGSGQVRGSVVHTYKRVVSSVGQPYEGEWVTGRSGTVILEWDNSYSAFTGKGLDLSVDVWEHSIQRPPRLTLDAPVPSGESGGDTAEAEEAGESAEDRKKKRKGVRRMLRSISSGAVRRASATFLGKK